MIELSAPELRALIGGECVVAFTERSAVSVGDEIDLVVTHTPAIDQIKSAYQRWVGSDDPDGDWSAVVDSVDPASILDPEAGSSRHVRTTVPHGDLLVLRVYGPDGPVLSDGAFEARRRSVQGALRH